MGKIVDAWVNKEYLSRGLHPVSSERELIRIASNIEAENEQLKLEIEDLKEYIRNLVEYS